MKLCAITVQKVIGFIVLAPLAFVVTFGFFTGVFLWITGGPAEDIKTMFIIFGFTVFGDFLVFSLTYPGFYDSMRVVKGIMSYHDLKKCIAKEVFEKPIIFWDKKFKKEDSLLYLSKEWVCVNGSMCYNKRNPVCIPRKMLKEYSIHSGEIAPRDPSFNIFLDTYVLTIETTTKYEITLGYIKPEEIEKVISILAQKIPEMKYADMLPE